MKACAKRAFVLAFVLFAVMNLINFGCINATISLPSGIKDGAHVWYRSVDFGQANMTDYTYVEFMEVHEHTAEMALRIGLLNPNDSEWSQHPPVYGYLDFDGGTLLLVNMPQILGYSFWASPGNVNTNTTAGFPPDSMNYAQVQCFVLESADQNQRSWYDQITGILLQTNFLSGDLTVRTVILYETDIPVGEVVTATTTISTQKGILPFEIPDGTTTYAALVGLVAVGAFAAIGLVRGRKSRGVSTNQCQSCGHRNKEDATFCSSCGSSLVAPSARAPLAKPEHISRVVRAGAVAVARQEPPTGMTSVRKPERPVSVVTSTREWEAETMRSVGSRIVCKTCGHVNPEWVRTYCVRCAEKLDMH